MLLGRGGRATCSTAWPPSHSVAHATSAACLCSAKARRPATPAPAPATVPKPAPLPAPIGTTTNNSGGNGGSGGSDGRHYINAGSGSTRAVVGDSAMSFAVQFASLSVDTSYVISISGDPLCHHILTQRYSENLAFAHRPSLSPSSITHPHDFAHHKVQIQSGLLLQYL